MPMRKQIIRGVLGLFALNLLMLAALALNQQIAARNEAARYPAPGRLIDMGGYRLHIDCTGQRDPDVPLVVLEGGVGAPGFMWSDVQPQIAQSARLSLAAAFPARFRSSWHGLQFGWSRSAVTPQPLNSASGFSSPHVLQIFAVATFSAITMLLTFSG